MNRPTRKLLLTIAIMWVSVAFGQTGIHDVIHHPLEALLLTRRKAPVAARGSDVALLGGSDFIVCGPYRCWRTGVVVVSPTYKSWNL